jgi:hypothetical protein
MTSLTSAAPRGPVITLGVIILVIGLLFGVGILFSLGLILVIIGAILFIFGRHWY